jgi:5-methylcytosine-specific restriction protein B
MAPDLAELAKLVFPGLDLAGLLEAINLRIEALLGREHCIGHAYFMPLRQRPTMAQLSSIFRLQIVPLLQEYFFEDWERVRWVLNDHRKKPEHQFIAGTSFEMDALFGGVAAKIDKGQMRWVVNDKAFGFLESYLGVLKA